MEIRRAKQKQEETVLIQCPRSPAVHPFEYSGEWFWWTLYVRTLFEKNKRFDLQDWFEKGQTLYLMTLLTNNIELILIITRKPEIQVKTIKRSIHWPLVACSHCKCHQHASWTIQMSSLNHLLCPMISVPGRCGKHASQLQPNMLHFPRPQ